MLLHNGVVSCRVLAGAVFPASIAYDTIDQSTVVRYDRWIYFFLQGLKRSASAFLKLPTRKGLCTEGSLSIDPYDNCFVDLVRAGMVVTRGRYVLGHGMYGWMCLKLTLMLLRIGNFQVTQKSYCINGKIPKF